MSNDCPEQQACSSPEKSGVSDTPTAGGSGGLSDFKNGRFCASSINAIRHRRAAMRSRFYIKLCRRKKHGARRFRIGIDRAVLFKLSFGLLFSAFCRFCSKTLAAHPTDGASYPRRTANFVLLHLLPTFLRQDVRVIGSYLVEERNGDITVRMMKNKSQFFLNPL